MAHNILFLHRENIITFRMLWDAEAREPLDNAARRRSSTFAS